MGFFKKIGKSLKGVTKMISFKNAVKVATGGGSSLVKELQGRVVKGLQSSDKRPKKAPTQTAQEPQISYTNELHQKELSENNAVAERQKTNPDFGDIMNAIMSGSLTSVGGLLGGTSTAGQAGSTIVDSTLKEWFKKNWWKVASGLVILGAVIYFAVRGGNKHKFGRR